MSAMPNFSKEEIKLIDDIVDCLMTTLRVQADHELQRNKVKDLNAE